MTARLLRTIGATATLVAGLGLSALPAAAVDYTSQPTVSVSDPSPSAGQSITVSGTTTPDTAVTITLSSGATTGGLSTQAATSVVLGSTVSDALGRYSLSVTIPTGLTGGNYVMAIAVAGNVVSSTAITLQSGAVVTTPRAGQLPVTGSNDSLPLAGLAMASIGVGGSLVAIARRTPTGL